VYSNAGTPELNPLKNECSACGELLSSIVDFRLKMKSLALGLDGRLASHKLPDIRAKENIRYELTQPQ
jgi:hypothetical protein